MLARAAQDGASHVVFATPDGAGNSRATLTGVRPGPHTLCAAALPGDAKDPLVRTRLLAHLDLLEGPCRHITVQTRHRRSEPLELTIEVPTPRRPP